MSKQSCLRRATAETTSNHDLVCSLRVTLCMLTCSCLNPELVPVLIEFASALTGLASPALLGVQPGAHQLTQPDLHDQPAVPAETAVAPA